MVQHQRSSEWGWLKGGVALGLLSAFAFLTYKPLGVSTSYPRTVALALNTVIPDWVSGNAYFQIVKPVVDWQLLLVVGIIVGGWLATRLTRPTSGAEPVRAAAPGTVHGTGQTCPIESGQRQRSPVHLFLGGFLLLFGARLAGGCTSGHVITGFSQLAVASFLFAAAVFGAGIPLARYMARREAS